MTRYQNSIGVKVPEILLPSAGVSLEKWAVVACDQYTSQPDYWEACEKIVGDAPSTLKIMLPELYLDKPDEAERIEKIRANMDAYMKEGVLENKGEGFVLVKRTCAGKTRVGLVMALDLEAYDYTKGSETLIRASEGTIVERIPPRLRIRWGAPLEMPHILVLIDDPNRTVIEPYAANSDKLEKLYDIELMQGGGHIEGYFVNDPESIEKTIACIDHLKVEFAERYGADRAPMLFAMGDGNHSFATAKANWEKLKAELPEAERENHPARYALVEIENVHDDGIVFEPIHRVVFGIEKDKAIAYLSEQLGAANGSCELKTFATREEMEAALADECKCAHLLPIVFEGGFGYFKVKDPAAQLAVGTLQNAIDPMLKAFEGSSVDYIHGAEVVVELGSKKGNMGFLLPAMAKSEFFDTVVYDGALPRKTFSMGEAEEKRYYLECRRILND